MSLERSNSEELFLSKYHPKETIGKGTFSRVKLGINNETKEKVAIKILEKKKLQNKDDLERAMREIEILKQLDNSNIIKTNEIFETKNKYYLIMEFCENGELFNYIVKRKRLNDLESSYFYYQLIKGLEYIHSKNIVHRDLKPENLLLTNKYILKIIDFGLSNFFYLKKEKTNTENNNENNEKKLEKENIYNNFIDINNLLKTPCGSPCYASPEMVSGKKYNGFKIDIWSSGIILYAMICGYLPFEDKNNDILFKKIAHCKIDYPNIISKNAKNLLKKIIVSDPNKRINIKEIQKEPFYLQGKEIFKRKHPDLFVEDINYDDEKNIENNKNNIREKGKENIDNKENIIDINIINNKEDAIDRKNINNKDNVIDINKINDNIIEIQNNIHNKNIFQKLNSKVQNLNQEEMKIKNNYVNDNNNILDKKEINVNSEKNNNTIENNNIKTEEKTNVLKKEFQILKENDNNVKKNNYTIQTQLKNPSLTVPISNNLNLLSNKISNIKFSNNSLSYQKKFLDLKRSIEELNKKNSFLINNINNLNNNKNYKRPNSTNLKVYNEKKIGPDNNQFKLKSDLKITTEDDLLNKESDNLRKYFNSYNNNDFNQIQRIKNENEFNTKITMNNNIIENNYLKSYRPSYDYSNILNKYSPTEYNSYRAENDILKYLKNVSNNINYKSSNLNNYNNSIENHSKNINSFNISNKNNAILYINKNSPSKNNFYNNYKTTRLSSSLNRKNYNININNQLNNNNNNNKNDFGLRKSYNFEFLNGNKTNRNYKNYNSNDYLKTDVTEKFSSKFNNKYYDLIKSMKNTNNRNKNYFSRFNYLHSSIDNYSNTYSGNIIYYS